MLDEAHEERIKQFARRFELAMDMNRVGLPDKFKGRNAEVARRVNEKFGVDITAETISKYTKAMMMPRPGRMQALASVLGVDLNWLQSGAGGEGPVYASGQAATASQLASRPASAGTMPNASVSKYLGVALAQLSGARIVDAPASGPVHFRAAVRGAVLSVHAVLAERVEEGWRVCVPKFASDTFILGILPETPTSFRMVNLYWDDVEAVGAEKGDEIEFEIDAKLRTGKVTWTELSDFGRLPH